MSIKKPVVVEALHDRYFDHIVGCLRKAHEKATEGMCSVSDDLVFRAMYLLKEQQARIERMTAGKASSPLDLETAKKLFEVNAYIWVRVLYFSFGNSSNVYHLRITDVCDEGIRIDAPSNTHALRYGDYGDCWEVYDREPT